MQEISRLLLFLTLVASVDAQEKPAEKSPEWIRGSWTKLELRIRGTVVSEPSQTGEVRVAALFNDVALPMRLDGRQFEFWVPVGQLRTKSYNCLSVQAVMSGTDSVFAGRVLQLRDLRHAAANGLKLKLEPPAQSLSVKVFDGEQPVANANVMGKTYFGGLLQTKTDDNGIARLSLAKHQRLLHVVAWTDDFRAGGKQVYVDRPHDPSKDSYVLSINKCREQKIRVVEHATGKGIGNLRFGHLAFTRGGLVGYVPDAVLVTDGTGRATTRWWPKDYGSLVFQPFGMRWAQDPQAKVREEAVVRVRESPLRRRVRGRVVASEPGLGVAGLQVTAMSFQGEADGRTDAIQCFTDANGQFFADYLSGSTYSIAVNDARLGGKPVAALPYDPTTDTTTRPKLSVQKSVPVQIQASLGVKPIGHHTLYMTSQHNVTWFAEGKLRSGNGGSRWRVHTDDAGKATTYATIGAEIQAATKPPGGKFVRSKTTKVQAEGDTVVRLQAEPTK